jgi:broad specificity phosphatase PhoE
MTLRLPAGVTLYFARHGETVANVEKRFSGRKDTPLTPRGREQARAIGLTLKRDVPDFAGLDYVASPLARARATMEIVRTVLGLTADAYRLEPRIAEIDLGLWDQLTDAEARALDPAYFDRRAADKWNVPTPGGENYEAVAARLTGWVAGLTTDTFAISHGAATRILRGLFAGLDADHMSTLDEPQGVVFRVKGSDVVMLPPADGAVSNPKPIG